MDKKDTSVKSLFLNPSAGTKLVGYIFLFIIFWVVIKLLEIRLAHAPIFQWWSKYGGNDIKDVSLTNIFAGYNSWIMFYLTKMNTSPVNSLDRKQIEFFVDHILKYSYYVDETGIGRGILIPAHIAKSAKIEKGQGIWDFDQWYDYNKKDQSVEWSLKTPTGVYPGNENISDWKDKMAEWGGLSTEDFWKTVSNVITINPNKAIAVEITKAWLDVTKNPDNFLARSGIMPDSPLILSYINQTYNDPTTGIILDAQAFKSLLGHSALNLGGWLGYLQGIQSANVSTDAYVNFLYTEYSLKPNPPPGNCGSGAMGWLGAGLSSLTAGAMGAFVGGPAGIALGVGLMAASLGGHAVKTAQCSK